MSNIHENNQKRRKRLTFRRFFWYNKGILLVVNGNCVFNFLQWAEERKVKVFQKGERVVCGSKGVCVVEEITTLDIAGVDKKREYYILKPLYLSSSTVYIPVDTAEGSMRYITAREYSPLKIDNSEITINGMAYNETEGLIDIFGGLKDIEAKMIRCVGNPEERFGEDALRIMRAIRFSAQLGYEIHEDTEAAIRKLAPTLQKISAERIQVELTKLLVSPHPDTLREAYDMGVTKVILPEFDAMMETPQKHKHHKYNVGEHTLHALMEIGPDKNMRYAMLLHDIGKPATLTVDEAGITHFYGHPAVGEEMARKILRRLRFDNDTVAVVTRLVRYHDYGNDVIPDLRIVRRAVNKIGEDIFPLLFPVKRADILAQSDYLRTEKLENLELWKKLYQEMLEKKQCVSLKTLAVTGRDLIDTGMKPGRELGEMLQQLLELVLEHPEQNTREQLLEKVKELSADKD